MEAFSNRRLLEGQRMAYVSTYNLYSENKSLHPLDWFIGPDGHPTEAYNRLIAKHLNNQMVNLGVVHKFHRNNPVETVMVKYLLIQYCFIDGKAHGWLVASSRERSAPVKINPTSLKYKLLGRLSDNGDPSYVHTVPPAF